MTTKRGYTEKPVDHPQELSVLWYFEPDKVDKYFDPYKYMPDKDEIEIANKRWPQGKYFWPKQMNDWVGNYWGKKPEKTFPITFEKADELIKTQKESNPQSLALWVINIDDLEKNVKGGWFAVPRDADIAKIKKKYSKEYGDLEKPLFFKLDPFFFKSESSEEPFTGLDKIDKPMYGESSLKIFELRDLDVADGNFFKYYIKRKGEDEDEDEYIGDHDYKDLYLVGRIVKKEIKPHEYQNCVIVVVAVKKQVIKVTDKKELNLWQCIIMFFRLLFGDKPQTEIDFEFEYQIRPPNVDGPDGPAGGAGMPP